MLPPPLTPASISLLPSAPRRGWAAAPMAAPLPLPRDKRWQQVSLPHLFSWGKRRTQVPPATPSFLPMGVGVEGRVPATPPRPRAGGLRKDLCYQLPLRAHNPNFTVPHSFPPTITPSTQLLGASRVLLPTGPEPLTQTFYHSLYGPSPEPADGLG